MCEIGFSWHIIEGIRKLNLGQKVAVKQWVWQGGVRLIVMFTRVWTVSSVFQYIYAESIMRKALQNYDGEIKFGFCHNQLGHAQNTTYLSGSMEELRTLWSKLKEVSAKKGLPLNARKTKIMVINDECTLNNKVIIDGKVIEKARSLNIIV